MTKILFVCLGNICRSPAGENVLRHLAGETGLLDSIQIDSAGTAGWHTGKSPDSRMTATLVSRDIPVTGSARQFEASDLEKFNLILAMDHDNYENILSLDDGTHASKVKMFTDFCTQHDDTFVPDPYYGGQEGFEHVADLLEDGCAEILRTL